MPQRETKTDMSIDNELQISCMGETLILNCQRAIYRPKTRSLLVSDVHLGKDEVFNRSGIALPCGVDAVNFERLSNLIKHYLPTSIIILGDLMHAAPCANDQWPSELSKFLDSCPKIVVKVVIGNHDRHHGVLDSRLTWISETLLDRPFIYTHHPKESETGYVLSGHIHPMYVLATSYDKLRLPAFWFKEKMAILPAFGEFTGGTNIRINDYEDIYVVGERSVIHV